MANETNYLPCKYKGNGVKKDFSFDWKIFKKEELIVFIEDDKGVQTQMQEVQDYTVDFDSVGGNVIFNKAPAENYSVIISRIISNHQSTSYSTSAGFQGSELEKSFDKVSCCLQDNEYTLQRAIKVPVGSKILDLTLPLPNAGKTLKWNNEETGLENSTVNVDMLENVSNRIHSSIENVDTVANDIQNVNNISENIEVVNTVANDIQNVNNVANDIDNVDTVANDIQNVNNISENIEIVNTVANNIQNVNNVANDIANVNLCAENLEPIINAPEIAETIRTKADEANVSAINAKNSATASANSATASASSASSAQTSASTATTQANNAKTSATNAQSYATQAQTTLNNATTTINTEKTNAVNAVKAQQSTSISAVQNQQNSSVNTVKSTGQSYVDKCKAWASSPNVVEGGLRSAKYYAEQAQGKSDVTYEHLRASRVYNDKGMLLTDEEGYANVAEMNRSTFDLSKFTVVGSPTITSDGVLSNCLGNNIVQTPPINITNPNWEFNFVIDINGMSGNVGVLGIPSIGFCYVNVNVTTEKCMIYLVQQWEGGGGVSIGGLPLNKKYQVVWGMNGTTHYSKIKEFGATEWLREVTNTYETVRTTSSAISIGRDTQNNLYLTSGSIDLKHFSIIVDGKEVFNGNKTRLDVIKEDNYTVVGSPVISDDGVASGFSGSNYLKTGVIIGQNPFKIICKCSTLNSGTGVLVDNISGNGWYPLLLQANNTIAVYAKDANGNGVYTGGSIAIPYNQQFLVSFEFTGNKYILGLSLNDGITWTYKESENANYIANIDKELIIGRYGSFAQDGWLGSIDLNAFQIYVDGQLVYQPCLKIPYNVSKTGSKIVPAYARDRVLDVYENHDKGYAYYTIDEENKNFTLPLGTTFDNSLRRNLENITENGNEKLATSLMYETGNVSNDEKGYKQLEKMNRSTFGLSKFTVVGSPTITEDGVASGWSLSNYLTKDLVIDFNKPFTIRGEFNSGNDLTVAQSVISLNSPNTHMTLGIHNDGYPLIYYPPASGVQNWMKASSVVAINTTYYYEIQSTVTSLKVFLGQTENSLQEVINIPTLKYNPVNITSSQFRIGCNFTGSYIMNGQINLPSISITVDGKEVFNGNKTGLDVIKEDNYTVVGSPTITSDGVASGFSDSNYIKTNFQIGELANKSWSVEGTVYLSEDIENHRTSIIAVKLSTGWVSQGSVGFNIDTGICNFNIRTGTSEEFSPEGWKISLNGVYTTEGWYKYKVEYNHSTGTYTLLVGKLGQEYSHTGSWTATTSDTQFIYINTNPTATMTIGVGSEGIYTDTLIDLNSFKIYIDGQLVYQPCLKIPYNVSKTGSKIVPAYARDRVIDLYEQEGHAGYYTIDEEKKNFTLPMGEIFGLIGQRSLRSVTRDGANYCEMYSDKTIEQGGTCTANVEVTLQQPFADTNYVLSVPYSNKTATSFIPTQTGDWIAKGKGV